LSGEDLLHDDGDEDDSAGEDHMISPRMPTVPSDVDPIILAKLKQQVREVRHCSRTWFDLIVGLYAKL
jgi:hypothetical protein